MTEAELLQMLQQARFDTSALTQTPGSQYYTLPGLDGARFERLQERYLDEDAFRAAYGQHADPNQAINPETGVDLRDPYYAMRDIGWQAQLPAGDLHGNKTHVFNLGTDGALDAGSYRLDDSGGSFVDHTLGKHGLSEMAETVAKDPKLMTFLLGSAGLGAYSALSGAGAAAGGTAGGTAGAGATASAVPVSSTGYMPIQTAAGIGEAAGVGSAGATGLGVSPAAMAAGAGATGAVGAGGAASGGLGSYLGDAAKWAAGNPGLVGAGLGALAGAASGSVDATQTGSRGLVDYALPAGQAYADMAQRTINGDYIGQGLGTNPYAGSNPYLGQAMDSVASRMTDAYRTGTAANTMSQFAQGGAFGGSAHRQMTALQDRAFADSLGSTLGNMQMQDYTQQQGLAENALQRQLSQFQGERGLMMNASGGLGQLGGTNTSTMQGVGPVQGALAGAMGGWAMGNAYQSMGGLGSQPLQTNTQGGIGYQPYRPVM